MRRIESPSSIITYKQCARKYYYQYILGLETISTIHTLRGKIVHSALENFFRVNIDKISVNNYIIEFKMILLDIFRKKWQDNTDEFIKINVTKEQIEFYFDETRNMLDNWLESFIEKIQKSGLPLANAFNRLKPITERELVSEKLGVRGVIDAIHQADNEITLLDYKTSSRDEITEDYRLQLAIYALLYYETYGKIPKKLCVNFLKHGEKFMDTDEELFNLAKEEIRIMHLKTRSDKIEDYSRNVGHLCKWTNGQCDFFDVCKPFD